MAYILPRAIIVLIAWGTTCLTANSFTAIDPLVFYFAGGIWSLVGVVSFNYLHELQEQAKPKPVRATAPVRIASK
jgi:hypothetical protein